MFFRLWYLYLMAKRLLLAIVFVFLLFALGSSVADAAILSVDKNGKIVWKVLSERDGPNNDIPTHSYIEVTKIADSSVKANTSIELSKSEGKIDLYVYEDNQKRQINITNLGSSVIEIEERAEVQKVNIGIKDDKFSLQQKGYFALTEFPIKINPESANLTLATGSGEKYLSILPYQIAQGALRSKIISRIDNNRLEIIEEERDLQYFFSGEKVFNILGFYEYSIPVSLRVSATTGETVSIEGPSWYKGIGFFLS